MSINYFIHCDGTEAMMSRSLGCHDAWSHVHIWKMLSTTAPFLLVVPYSYW